MDDSERAYQEEYRAAINAAAEIPGTGGLRLVAHSKQRISQARYENALHEDYLRRIASIVSATFRRIQLAMAADDAVYSGAHFHGLELSASNDNHAGYTLPGDPIDLVLIDPVANTAAAKDALGVPTQPLPDVAIPALSEGLASELVNTIVHELTHQRVLGHGSDFDVLLDRNLRGHLEECRSAKTELLVALEENDHAITRRLIEELNRRPDVNPRGTPGVDVEWLSPGDDLSLGQ